MNWSYGFSLGLVAGLIATMGVFLFLRARAIHSALASIASARGLTRPDAKALLYTGVVEGHPTRIGIESVPLSRAISSTEQLVVGAATLLDGDSSTRLDNLDERVAIQQLFVEVAVPNPRLVEFESTAGELCREANLESLPKGLVEFLFDQIKTRKLESFRIERDGKVCFRMDYRQQGLIRPAWLAARVDQCLHVAQSLDPAAQRPSA